MLDQEAGGKRIRSLALASIVVVVLALGPLAWWAMENVIAAEHLNDPVCQTSIWACIFYPAIVAAALVAGWARRRS
jgi:cytosine/uracil/thiamine/allantoin permease